jgi:archaellum component FlaC
LNKPLGARPADEAVDVRTLLDSTTRSVDDIQKTIEDRLARSTDKAEMGGVKEGISQLNQKLNSLETRLRQFELEN